ncbi:restriction endonuclease subunit S [Paenibacillus filicis]|uniref:Restriction endonuclease subunit S n=1 Tax=Paenibacillus gyeongsangnamensis TaxID=3388067 RepID=A0ABT4QL21_9BACL|nr:restriction endonuclease subunit S [Paenibacillus filicis]MCZ8517560.1 restriction endonuclease subunit S [Paenibacillus filicis]
MKLKKSEVQQLRNMVTLEKGKPPAKQPYFGHDAELYLTPEYLRGRESAEPVKPSVNAVRVHDGDTIVLWDGSNAGEIFRARTGILSSTMSRITHDDTFDKEYFFFAVKTWESFLKGQTSGSGIPHVDKEVLGKIEIIRFVMTEQVKIAEILSTVDRGIKKIEVLIDKQQRIKSGLMKDLLTGGIDEKGKIRSELTHEYQDSALGRIPLEWDVKPLGECCEVFNNLRKPISTQIRETMKGDYPYYGPTGILDYINEYRVEGKFVLIGEDGDHFLKFKTQEMTLLVNGKYNVNNHAHLIQGKDIVLTEWAHLFFLHRDITLHLTRQGAGRFKLNKAALLELPIAFPEDIAEQERILTVMNGLRESQIININTLKKLKSLKTALMQDLLTGKKRVTLLQNDLEVIPSESGPFIPAT